jgi:hypothetical protein
MSWLAKVVPLRKIQALAALREVSNGRNAAVDR